MTMMTMMMVMRIINGYKVSCISLSLRVSVFPLSDAIYVEFTNAIQ